MTDGPGPGWYPDPWAGGNHRYWDGTAWTGDSFPGAPAPATEPAVPPPYLPRGTPPPPQWNPPTARLAPPSPTVPFEVSPRLEPDKASPLSSGLGFVVLVVVMMLVVGSLAVVGAYYAFGGGSGSATPAAAPVPVTPVTPAIPLFPGRTPGTPAPPSDPSVPVLAGLVVTQADVVSPVVVETDPDGRGVAAAPSLNLCNGDFPSESSRTARLQVSAADSAGAHFLSTEAVLYEGAADTSQGFSELKAVAAACPASMGHFNPAPDAAWPAVPTVDRLAFDLVETGITGAARHTVAVYLRRGRALMGLYFDQPDGAQPSVAGQTTLAGITNVFAERMARLPASVTG